jgi:hypothetical protein
VQHQFTQIGTKSQSIFAGLLQSQEEIEKMTLLGYDFV